MLVGMQASETTLKKIWRLLKNLNIDLPYDSVIPILGLFTIAKLWKQPRCPTTDK
jgi:hypothetical protein